ncbi:hypothetical protein N665_0060s0035 [Sinapis alba]|nr:hypothetical protein N665_0060s0035 [Sinapis alba]
MSIVKCRCVSKFWDSILRCVDFTELFITRSRAHPQLLLSYVDNNELFLFSIPQVQNQDVIATNYDTRFPWFTEVTVKTKCFELWVLDAAEKHELPKHISILLPPLWKNIVADASLFFVGVTGTNEIVLSPSYVSKPYCFYVYYYNIESNTI